MQLRYFFLVILLVSVHLTLLINTRFTLWPEMVVYPYLLNNGFHLYSDLINPYPPFLAVFLSLFTKLFGYQPVNFQLLTWILIVAIDLLVFWVTRKITNSDKYAIVSLIFFAIFSLPFGVNSLWFDLVQTPLILLGVYNLIQFLKYRRTYNFFYLTFLTTIALFIKQQALWLLLWFILIWLIKTDQKVKKLPVSFSTLTLLLAPGILIFSAHLLFFSQEGTVNDLIFWTFQFPLLHASNAPGYLLLPTTKQLFIILLPLIISLPALISKKVIPKYLVFAALPLVLFAYPRFDYFHLIPYLSVISLSAGLVFVKLKNLSISQKSVSIIALVFLMGFSARYYIVNWQSPIRFFEPQIITAANTLKSKLPKGEHIYIQNGPDQLLPLSNTLPTKPWADDFPWYLETQNLQEKVVDSLEKDDPRYIVFQPYMEGEKYELGSYRPEKIVNYVETHYSETWEISSELVIKKRIGYEQN